jgi:(1->4)-alpha-D-glucan 1-alpha-D-glucosylmutase
MIKKTLEFRRNRPELFGADGCYRPVAAHGSKGDHVLAFLRGNEVATLVPRISIRRGNEWGDTTISLPKGEWRNELTGENFAQCNFKVAELLNEFPVALLSRVSAK